jgi:hypothetical protein
MDRLIVMDRGRIVEEGDHQTLLAEGGLYARLWAHQSGGFLGERLDEDEPLTAPPGVEADGEGSEALVPGIERARRDAASGSR